MPFSFKSNKDAFLRHVKQETLDRYALTLSRAFIFVERVRKLKLAVTALENQLHHPEDLEQACQELMHPRSKKAFCNEFGYAMGSLLQQHSRFGGDLGEDFALVNFLWVNCLYVNSGTGAVGMRHPWFLSQPIAHFNYMLRLWLVAYMRFYGHPNLIDWFVSETDISIEERHAFTVDDVLLLDSEEEDVEDDVEEDWEPCAEEGAYN